jgi:hypothetical protein
MSREGDQDDLAEEAVENDITLEDVERRAAIVRAAWRSTV